jgi:hypothetical protein
MNYQASQLNEIDILVKNKKYEAALLLITKMLNNATVDEIFKVKLLTALKFITIEKSKHFRSFNWTFQQIKYVLINPMLEEMHPIAFFYLHQYQLHSSLALIKYCLMQKKN